ncbi:hypothetical protein ACFQT0_04000 [Hymenobacter humi]|uniref:Uncharacterized protein n=1 Tax=Hymenobacter humi TaxID=1411620 RepID=A0ABW2U169_9BACT
MSEDLNPAENHESEADFESRWETLMQEMEARFGKRPDLNALLLLIGIQELNQGITTFTKEQKQDLMHIATCRLFSLSGHYEPRARGRGRLAPLQAATPRALR